MILVFEVMYVGFRVCAEGVLEEKLKSLNEDGKEKCYIRNLEVTSGALNCDVGHTYSRPVNA